MRLRDPELRMLVIQAVREKQQECDRLARAIAKIDGRPIDRKLLDEMQEMIRKYQLALDALGGVDNA